MVQAQQVSAVARPLRTHREAGADGYEESIPPIAEAPTIPADIPEHSQPVSPAKLELPRHDEVPSPAALLDAGLKGDASGSEASLIEHVWD